MFYSQRSLNPFEDIVHVLRVCKAAREVWRYSYPMIHLENFFYLSLKEWLGSNLKCKAEFRNELGWAEKMSIVCWWLLEWKNAKTFKGENISPTERVRCLRGYFEEAEMAAMLFNPIASVQNMNLNEICISVRWSM